MRGSEAFRRQLEAMLDKGQRVLRAAREHHAEGDADFASSKAYYAVFHLMQAVLLTKRRTFSKHAGVISGFSEHFIKPGLFPKDFARVIQKLRRDRELGDYGYQQSVSLAEAKEDVKEAARIFARLKEYLQPFLHGRYPREG